MFEYFRIFAGFYYAVVLFVFLALFLGFYPKSDKALGAISSTTPVIWLLIFRGSPWFNVLDPLTDGIYYGVVVVLVVISLVSLIYVLEEERKKASVYKASVWLRETIHYNIKDLRDCLVQYAQGYVRTKPFENELRDAVLVDSINYIGLRHGFDFAFYTSALYRDNETVEPKTISADLCLSIMRMEFDKYILGNIPASIRHMKLQQNREIDDFECVAILADFMNYIASKSEGRSEGREYYAEPK